MPSSYPEEKSHGEGIVASIIKDWLQRERLLLCSKNHEQFGKIIPKIIICSDPLNDRHNLHSHTILRNCILIREKMSIWYIREISYHWGEGGGTSLSSGTHRRGEGHGELQTGTWTHGIQIRYHCQVWNVQTFYPARPLAGFGVTDVLSSVDVQLDTRIFTSALFDAAKARK